MSIHQNSSLSLAAAPAMESSLPPLTAIQQQVITLLAGGASVTAAAEATGLHRTTITHWRRTLPGFAQALRHAQEDHTGAAREELAALLPQAHATLRTLLTDEATPPAVRLKAALEVIRLASGPDPATALPPQDPPPGYLSADQYTAGIVSAINTYQSCQQEDASAVSSPALPSRNQLCPCGSGAKYKRCCALRPSPPATP